MSRKIFARNHVIPSSGPSRLDPLRSFAFLTNHGLVLLCIAENPGVRMRDIAAQVNITERTRDVDLKLPPERPAPREFKRPAQRRYARWRAPAGGQLHRWTTRDSTGPDCRILALRKCARLRKLPTDLEHRSCTAPNGRMAPPIDLDSRNANPNPSAELDVGLALAGHAQPSLHDATRLHSRCRCRHCARAAVSPRAAVSSFSQRRC